jgi:hypothetical protein
MVFLRIKLRIEDAACRRCRRAKFVAQRFAPAVSNRAVEPGAAGVIIAAYNSTSLPP